MKKEKEIEIEREKRKEKKKNKDKGRKKGFGQRKAETRLVFYLILASKMIVIKANSNTLNLYSILFVYLFHFVVYLFTIF